jgi:hypothetical protein
MVLGNGCVPEIFDPRARLFHQSTPHTINRLNPFRIWHRIRQNNRFEWLRVVNQNLV